MSELIERKLPVLEQGLADLTKRVDKLEKRLDQHEGPVEVKPKDKGKK